MLDAQRQKIDALDQQIVHLLEARMAEVAEVARIKKHNHLAVLDEQREGKVLEKVASYVTEPYYRDSIVALYQAMLSISKEYQEKENQSS